MPFGDIDLKLWQHIDASEMYIKDEGSEKLWQIPLK